MDCERAKELFIDYHDGDIGSADRRELEKHLADCAECGKEWDEYLRCVGEVSGMHVLAPSDEFVSRVKKTIGRRSRGRFFGDTKPFSLSFALVSFILILLFLLAYLFLAGGKEIELVAPPQSTEEDTNEGEEPNAKGRP